MLRFTLDTSCVIHAVAGQAYAAHVEELASLCRQGWAEIWLTTAFNEDQENAGDVRRAANSRWISQRPVMGQIPQPLGLDDSPLDDRSILIDERTVDARQAIEEILLPPGLRVGALDPGDSQLMARWRKRIRDVQHLASHFFHGHDVFVTSDNDDMINRRDELRRRTGIVIGTPAEAVLRIRNSRGQAPRWESRPTSPGMAAPRHRSDGALWPAQCWSGFVRLAAATLYAFAARASKYCPMCPWLSMGSDGPIWRSSASVTVTLSHRPSLSSWK